MKKRLWVILGILVLLIIVVLAVRFFSGEDSWICSNGQWVKHGYPIKPAPSNSCGQANGNNQTGSQTYNYVGPVSFSIDYPNGWAIQSSDDTGIVFFNQADKSYEPINHAQCQKVVDGTWKQGDAPCGPDFIVRTFSIAISQKSPGMSLDDFINSQPGADTIITREKLTLLGLNAVKTTRPAMSSGLVDYIEKGDYVLIVPQYAIDEKTFNDFLNSIKFTENDTNSGQTNKSLKTYTNSFWGISFQYPEDYLVENDSNLEGSAAIKVLSKSKKEWEQTEIAKCQKTPNSSSCGVNDAVFVDGLIITKASQSFDGLSLRDWVAENVVSIYSQENIKIGGVDAVNVIQMGLDNASVFIANKNNIYQFHKFSNTDPVFDQIINSIKFDR